MKHKTLTIILLLLAFVSVAYAVDFDKSTVFLSDINGGNITFAENITANQVETPVNNQVRFTNLTYGSYNFGNIGFRAPTTSLTMNTTSINATDITVNITQTNTTDYELWLPNVEPVSITGADSSSWNDTSRTLFITMDINGTFNVNFEEIVPPLTYYPLDYYNSSTASGTASIKDEHPSDSADDSAHSQSFTVTQSARLTHVILYIKRTGTPNGFGTVKIYNITGNYGTTSLPDVALAISDPFDWALLPTTYIWETFNFSGDNQIYLTTGQYALSIEGDGTTSVSNTRYIDIRYGGAHGGNRGYYQNGAWTANFQDLLFYVYGTRNAPTITCQSDSTFVKDVYGVLNATVTDLETTDDIQQVDVMLNSSGDTNQFILRWANGTGFSEVSDNDTICSLNVSACGITLTGNTTMVVSFVFAITGGLSGNYDVNITAYDYGSLETSTTFSNQFSFTYYNWGGAVYDLINSAFAFFGIIDFMTQIQTAITGLVGYFADALTNVVALIQAQFSIITNVFPWFLRWFVRIVNRLVAMGGILVSIFNGTNDIMTGLGSLWDLVELSAWTDIIVLLAIFAWIESIIRRGRTQGEIQVFISDLQTMMNILGYFMNMFMTVINFIVDYTFRLFDAIL